jgi:lysozyme
MNQQKFESAIKIAIPEIKKHEGFRANAYKDVVGIVTIGYGFTAAVIPGLKMGDTITQAKADMLLESKVRTQYAKPVAGAIKVWDDPQFTPSMFATLVSMAYNLGPGLKNHDIIKRINERNYSAAAELITQPAYLTAGGKFVRGLQVRRIAEKLMFLKGYAKPAGVGLGVILVAALAWYLWNQSKKGSAKAAFA